MELGSVEFMLEALKNGEVLNEVINILWGGDKDMGTTKGIEKIWAEFEHDFYRIAEALLDLRDESEKEINRLQAEID